MTDVTEQTQVVLFEERKTSSGFFIGIATLNSPQSLNALSLEMVNLLSNQLEQWQSRTDIVMVMLDGSGDKAFCAGGDVVDLYHASKLKSGQDVIEEAEAFFATEYRLDFMLHNYAKPLVVWGDGIVMGGGIGLFAGGSHRIVTERSRLAMPEITIGLYPDVGGSYFLNQMPPGCGLLLGLTGAIFNAKDALYSGLANHVLPSDAKASFIDRLININWQDLAEHSQVVTHTIQELAAIHACQLPSANLEPLSDLMATLSQSETVVDAFDAITTFNCESEWLTKAKHTMLKGSPLSAHIIMRQIQQSKGLTLAECFKRELGMSLGCCSKGDFVEGVRALLVDKDRNPTWLYQDVASVDLKRVEDIFSSPWPEHQHPLADLY